MVFKCHHPGCTRSYKRKEHLLRHQKDHSNLRAFVCRACSSAFNRRDLLNRHLVYSHGLAQKKPGSGPLKRGRPVQEETKREGNTGDGSEFSNPRVEQLGGSILVDLGAELAQTFNKTLLQEHYFRGFHPHWPILHQEVFQNSEQPVELVEAVMVAGLWTTRTTTTKDLAESLHDRLDYRMREYLAKFNYDRESLITPQHKDLPLLQTFMITMILFTYRGARFYPKTIVDYKRLFRLFDYYGLFDQQRINAESPSDWLSREQGQRLALIIFKVFVHFNALLLAHSPKFRLLDYFEPSMLKVRPPSAEVSWNSKTVDCLQDVEDDSLVDCLFTGSLDCQKYSMLSSIAAWDFSTGMILGCYTQRQPGGSLVELMEKAKPFLSWHIQTQAVV